MFLKFTNIQSCSAEESLTFSTTRVTGNNTLQESFALDYYSK